MVIYTIQIITIQPQQKKKKKKKKEQDTGTLNIFLLYIIFRNDFS